MRLIHLCICGVIASSFSAVASEIVRIDEQAFKSSAGLIRFSEYPIGTRSPVYEASRYGGGEDAPGVATGGWFEGLRLSRNPRRDCPRAAATACVVGEPNSPLRLDPKAPKPFITIDGAFPTSPTLSGSPKFNGPIALVFDRDQVAVGFEGGHFDVRQSTGITAFDRQGRHLGTVANRAEGIEFLGLVMANGKPGIAGVMLDLVGAEPAGFNIDNIRFGQADDVDFPPEVILEPPIIACCH